MKKRILASISLAAVALTGCPQTSSCIARGSRVWTPDGWRPIEELQVGDPVYCVDEETGERFEAAVVATRSATREVGAVRLGDTILRMTTDHPVYCPRQGIYAPAGDWFLKERAALAFVGEGGIVLREPDSVELFAGVSEVFDITVDHDLHNFVVEGVLVHNKSPICESPCGDPFDVGEAGDSGGDSGEVADATGGDTGSDVRVDTDDAGEDGGSLPDLGPDAAGDLGVDAGTLRERGTCGDSNPCPDASWDCIPIASDQPGAYHTCQPPTAAEPGCDAIEPPDSCCVHADCTMEPSGKCVLGPIFYCGGAAPQPANVCLYDECSTDADCGDATQFCLPARVLGEPVARCALAECRLDTDCNSRAGGQCEAFFDPCNGRFSGFHCTYDDSACRTNADCPGPNDDPENQTCTPGPDGATQCTRFLPPP